MRKKINLPWPVYATIFVVLFLLGFGYLNALSSRPPESAPRDEWETVMHELYDFSLDYPPRWLAETYGEFGFKGDRESKLRINRGFAGTIYMEVLYRPAANPQLEDVVKWGESRGTLGSGNADVLSFEEIELNGHKVMKRIYQSTRMFQDVYIARENDMIIIKLQAQEIDFGTFWTHLMKS